MLQTIQQRLHAVQRFGIGIHWRQLFSQSKDTATRIVLLKTQRLLVRDAVPTDLDALYSYMTQESVCRREHLSRPSLNQVAVLLRYCKRQQIADPRSVYSLVAVLQATEAIIGHARLVIHDWVNSQGKLTLGVDGRYNAQDFEIELGAAMLRFGFGTLRLHRITAQCDVEDLAASNVLEELGMRPEGTLRDNIHAEGRWWSSYQWSLLAHEHKATNKLSGTNGPHGA